MEQMHSPWSNRARWIALAVLTVGMILRLLNFPALHEIRDTDELTYIENGLLVWEGMVPGAVTGADGPETWMGWTYIAGQTALKFIHPSTDQPKVPTQVRPFTAVDRALFDTYADMSCFHRYMAALQLLIALAAIYAAFRLGWHYGGWAGGIAAGGVVACLPLYIEFAAMTRPYSDGWAFGLVALAAAATLRGGRRVMWGGVFFGLSVGSRIDMVMIAPLMAWILWQECDKESLWRTGCRLFGVAVVTSVLSCPWLLQSLIGTLRAIATIRFSDQWADQTRSPKLDTLLSLAWDQGLGLLLLVMLAGLFLTGPQHRVKTWVLAILTALFLSTMFSGPYKPMRYHGAPLLAIVLFGTVTFGQLVRRWPKAMAAAAAFIVLLPLVQGTRQALTGYAGYRYQDDSIAWLEAHVRAGTRVYILGQFFDTRAVLPTPQAADAMWGDVIDDQPWRKKFEHGLARFHLVSDDIPRALSEQNLVAERGIWRRWFILGGQASVNRPRYDIRLACTSKIFGVVDTDLQKEFARTGGIVLCWDRERPAGLVPYKSWVDAEGHGKFLYCSDDVKARLVNVP